MSYIKISPAKGLNGVIKIPGDKSISHRAVILGALSCGDTNIHNFLYAQDTMRTVQIFQDMGVEIQGADSGSTNITIYGKGLQGLKPPTNVLYAGNSGTTMRLMLGVLAGQKFKTVITGDESLKKRPMHRVVEPLQLMGTKIYNGKDGNFAPLTVQGGKLKAIKYIMPVASAQVKSAVLLAGLWADGETVITESVKSRDHTERMLKFFGARIHKKGNKIAIKKTDKFVGKKVSVPGDISSAAFFLAAGCFCKNSDLMLLNVGINPTRIGIITVLKKMGADIEIINKHKEGFEPVADIRVKSSNLKGIIIEGGIIPKLIDEIPIIAVAASFAKGKTIIRNAQELKFKESNRIISIITNLRKLGVTVEELNDGMVIYGGEPLIGANLDSYGDHRIAMSMAIAGLSAIGETKINDTECINTSFPEFMDILEEIRQ
ncbi:MAG: 3-phosphoshikimate 1-carboxyvinyltransferase [Candidatus Firestonebacteria bacterium]